MPSLQRSRAIQAPAENCSCIFGVHAVHGDKKAAILGRVLR